MTSTNNTRYPTASGYMTEQTRLAFIKRSMSTGDLPEQAHRMAHILSLEASADVNQPIQFWQLYSVLGQDRIVDLVRNFYQRVFEDENWFTSVFARVGGIGHHVNTQAGMWIDVMGGGRTYHGGEYRLSFHHTHNAIQLMNDKGAERWIKLMRETLDEPDIDLTDDPRVRVSINTFLAHFLSKYAAEFNFSAGHDSESTLFGPVNQPVTRKINLFNMTSEAIEALTESDLKKALSARGIDVSAYSDKTALVNKALSL